MPKGTKSAYPLGLLSQSHTEMFYIYINCSEMLWVFLFWSSCTQFFFTGASDGFARTSCTQWFWRSKLAAPHKTTTASQSTSTASNGSCGEANSHNKLTNFERGFGQAKLISAVTSGSSLGCASKASRFKARPRLTRFTRVTFESISLISSPCTASGTSAVLCTSSGVSVNTEVSEASEDFVISKVSRCDPCPSMALAPGPSESSSLRGRARLQRGIGMRWSTASRFGALWALKVPRYAKHFGITELSS